MPTVLASGGEKGGYVSPEGVSITTQTLSTINRADTMVLIHEGYSLVLS